MGNELKELKELLNKQHANLPEDIKNVVKKGKDVNPKHCLEMIDMDRLLKENFVVENGFRHFSDGKVYVQALTKMKSVSIEMINWWFWWHPKHSIRYQIWYPGMHYEAKADFNGHYEDESLSLRERLNHSIHYVVEDIGTGKEKVMLDFMSPEDFGFDKTKLKNDDSETIICARVGSPTRGIWHTKMCHVCRKTDEGIEMRSRFWIGYELKRITKFGSKILNHFLNKPIIKSKLIPKDMGKHMFFHCVQEYHNLREILPKLYSKYSQE